MTHNDTKLNRRYLLVLETLDRLERGMYSGLDAHWCSDSIGWLWKWKKINQTQMHELCDRVIALFKKGCE
jgi:hypothetical protein